MTIERVERFITCDDGKEHHTFESAKEWQDKLDRAKAANLHLVQGKTLGFIFNNIMGYPCKEELEHINKDFEMIISHWQCQENPGYKVVAINPDGSLIIWGDAGSWTGPYGCRNVNQEDAARYVEETKRELSQNNPHP